MKREDVAKELAKGRKLGEVLDQIYSDFNNQYCSSCRFCDRSMVLTSLPPQYKCASETSAIDYIQTVKAYTFGCNQWEAHDATRK